MARAFRAKITWSYEKFGPEMNQNFKTPNWVICVTILCFKFIWILVDDNKCQQVTRKVLRKLTLDSTQRSRSSSTFSFCVWVPVCATLACWQVSNATRIILGLPKWSLSFNLHFQRGVKAFERRMSKVIRPLIEVSLNMRGHQAAAGGRELEHDLHEQSRSRHLSCVLIQESIDVALVITSQG